MYLSTNKYRTIKNTNIKSLNTKIVSYFNYVLKKILSGIMTKNSISEGGISIFMDKV